MAGIAGSLQARPCGGPQQYAGSGRAQGARAQRGDSSSPVARATTRSVKDSSSLKITLQTAEGDTVEISLDAQSLTQRERASARGPDGHISQKTDTQSDNFSASVNVTGNLSDTELKDIQGLLQKLSGGGDAPATKSDLGTISAYQYSFQRTREVSQSKVELYG